MVFFASPVKAATCNNNGVIEAGEECDDGNANGTTTSICSSDCTVNLQVCSDIFGIIGIINARAKTGSLAGAWSIFDYASCIVWGVINFLIDMGLIVAAGFVIFGGISYITSFGNAKKQEAAIKTLNTAIIGLALLLVSWAAYGFVLNFIEYNAFVQKFQGVEINIPTVPTNTPPAPSP